MTDLPKVREESREQTPEIIVEQHPHSMFQAAICLLREKPPALPSLIVIISICGMVLAVVAHGDVATFVIGAIVVTSLVVAGLRVK